MTTFSVIMPTRNRPDLFAVALASVTAQRGAAFEIVIVMDGSAPEHDPAYAALLATTAPEAQVIRLERTARGHGQSYAINRGAAEGRGDYLCFLDDDDCWTDPDHLARAAATIDAAGADVDLYLADQDAYRGDVRATVQDGVWIEGLRIRPDLLGPPDAQGARRVSAAVLMDVPKHCHLNSTIIHRTLFEAIRGLDEDIRYDCDRDFYLRAVDRAKLILYAGRVVSRHNIPDPAKGANMSTETSAFERQLYQLKVFDKSILFAAQGVVVAHALRHKAFVLRHMAVALDAQNRDALAAHYAGEALGARFTLKWFGYWLWLRARVLLARG